LTGIKFITTVFKSILKATKVSLMSTPVQIRMRELSGTNFINHKWIKSKGALRDVIDPATEEVVAQFAEATQEETNLAIEKANLAQRQWWAMSALDRANALHRANDREFTEDW
jgi:betaine-aldehyde dehydrogenase